MSPFSVLLRDLRTFCGLKQAEFAEKVGVEQSYVSAIEVGGKGPPGRDFVERLVEAFDLDSSWEQRLHEAIEQSHRRLELPKNASIETYKMFNGLRIQMEKLHPAQIELIEFALKLPAVIRIHDSNMRVVKAATGESGDKGSVPVAES
jgi:transcriptional regulator with XRE-family HTH domain